MAAILIIDDEPLVAQMIRRTIEDQHVVTVQNSAAGALALIEGGARFDLLITDLQMPGGDGIWLSDTLAQKDPALARRMIFLTGGATTPKARAFLQRADIEWMEKPFRPAELRERIDRVLRSAG
jgi:CheY-like chemotaxis protein